MSTGRSASTPGRPRQTERFGITGLLERVGDTNARVKDAAAEAVQHLATVPAAGLTQATGLIIKCACRSVRLFQRGLASLLGDALQAAYC